tara:strand:- start:1821 stop:2942 length:1122 start_codon:yes stop_codon:yes gene_type:complete
MPKFYSDVVLNDGALQAKTNGQTDLGTSNVKLKNAFFAGEVDAAGGFVGDVTGNADTATTLATARNINGVSFNGSANITVPILGEADQELTQNREVDLADNLLSFKNGNANIMVLQDGLVTISEPVLFTNSNGYTAGEIRLKEAPAAAGDEHVGFKASGSLTASTVWELPAADGSNGQVLSTNGSAVLSWASAGSGGGMTETPITALGGRAQWSSVDDGERVIVGGSYGAQSFYSHSQELSSYSSGTVDSTAIALSAYLRNVSNGIFLPSDSKKVRLKIGFRLQNAPTNSTWGVSMWSGPVATGGSTSNANITLRAQSDDITQVSNSSIRAYSAELDTTSAITDELLFITLENRSGSLTSTTYMYFNISLYAI